MSMVPRIDFSFFLNRDKVKKLLQKRERRWLARSGGFIRKSAINSIKNKNYNSKPGDPPHSRTGQYKKSIFFAYDAVAGSVQVGTRAEFGRRGSNVPELLEFGGQTTDWRTGKPATYRARPHMGPALENSQPAIAKFWNEEMT